MIPNMKVREVTTSGVQESTSFGISSADSAHIMNILRDTLYSDKVLAVLREYSANAWDAHRTSGKGDVPIKVTLPTMSDQTLTIRDYGTGLSHDDIFNVFTQYGASTKRGTDNAVGMLGIGSKSGFAYADTFTITSWHKGWRGVYAAVLDPSDKGELKLLDQGDAGDETGVQIQIAVKPGDIHEFHEKARSLFQWFQPRPVINTTLPEVPEGRPLVHGRLDNENTYEWVAVMGCIAYRVNPQQLTGVDAFNQDLFGRVSGALYFNIGDVAVNASREELKYSDATKAKLVEKFNLLVDEYTTTVMGEIENDQVAPWEKRLRAQVLHRLAMPVPKDENSIFARYVSIPVPPTTFAFQRNTSITNRIEVSTDVRLLLQDDKRSLRGFNLRHDDLVVKPLGRSTLAEVQKELEMVLAAVQMTGVPVALISTLPWTPSRRGSGNGLKNPLHRVRTFRFKAPEHVVRPYSNNWDAETERTATEDDVYVILENFKATSSTGTYDFYSDFVSTSRMAKAFNIAMPTVYGYKSTEAKPVHSATGITYATWKASFLKQLNTDRAKELVNAFMWSKAVRYDYRLNEKEIKSLKEALGEDHAVCGFVMKFKEAKKLIDKCGLDERALNFLRSDVCPKNTSDVSTAEAAILERYPLFSSTYSNLDVLWTDDNRCKHWRQYVKLIDATENA